MTFTLYKTSKRFETQVVEINTLDELIELQDKSIYDLIIQCFPSEVGRVLFPATDGRFIEIYDSERE